MELFQRGWKIKQKKRVSSLILFSRKSEFEFTFFLFTSTAYNVRPIRVEFFSFRSYMESLNLIAVFLTIG